MLKVVELFAGIGAPRKALKNLNIDHEVVAFSEIDKFAIESYRAIHSDYTTKNFGDIREIMELPKCDLLTYGFPCQDISVAGKGRGIKEGTRSGLLLEVERLLDISKHKNKLPKYLLMENVAALMSKKHIKDFESLLLKLERLGYKNFYKVLNAKDYGIPQNRERIFCISVRNKNFKYIFPKKMELKLKLRDLLEDEVDQKHYLKDVNKNKFLENLGKQGYIIKEHEANALGTNTRNNLVLPCLNPEKGKLRQNGRRIKGNDEEMFTLTTQDRHGIIEVENKIIDDGISYCIDANYSKGTNLKGFLEKNRRQLIQDDSLKIRRLMPLECWRLMGFTDIDFQKIKSAGISDSQAYKQAGNSIVVNVLERIFENLFLNTQEQEYKLF